MAKFDSNIPIYQGYKYQYVRMGDIKADSIRKKLFEYTFSKVCPLRWTKETGVIRDAVFLEDYKNFLELHELI